MFMIRLFSKLCKCFQQNRLNSLSDVDIFNMYIENINVSELACPSCGAKHSLTYLCSYTRHLIIYHNGKVSDNIINVPRLVCGSCRSSRSRGSTHAILPPVIVPYKSYGFSFLISVLHDYIVKKFTSLQLLCEHYSLPESTFRRILKEFKLHKDLWLGLLESKTQPNQKFISKLKYSPYIENENFISEFFNRFKISFLQQNVKLGIP